MLRPWKPRWSVIFTVATILGLVASVAVFRLRALQRSGDILWLQFLILNLASWYIAAAAAPTIIRLAQQFRFDRPSWARAALVHLTGIVCFSIGYIACMMLLRVLVLGSAWKPAKMPWWPFVQQQYLMALEWDYLTYLSIVVLTHAVEYYREAQERAVQKARLETSLVQAQLKALQAELHPHFLFNTLHAISALMATDPEGAERMISGLGELLRLTLSKSGVQEVPLAEELEVLEKYLDIEQMRFRDRLQVRFDIEPEALHVPVPWLLLQPIVENAIKHGIGPRDGPGEIGVTARRKDGHLRLEVRDNGVGPSGGQLLVLRKGLGLSNTRSRLELLYGSNHRLEFANTGTGLTVRVVIPIRPERSDAAPEDRRTVPGDATSATAQAPA